MGLQITKAGYKSWIVPTTGYEHEWSVSIRSLRTIKYLNKEETANEIHARNKNLFIAKWGKIDSEIQKSGKESILISKWLEYIIKQIEELTNNNKFEEAKKFIDIGFQQYPDNEILKSLLSEFEQKL